MPVFTQEQIDRLTAILASGVKEMRTPDKVVQYADSKDIRDVLAAASTEEPQTGAFRAFATFYRP